MKAFTRLLVLCTTAAASAFTTVAIAHESPVDHIDRDFRILVKNGALTVTYRVGLTERAALLQLKAMDTDSDARISDTEADAFFTAQAKTLADLLVVQIDGKPVTLTPAGSVQRDLRLGQTYTFTAPLSALTPGRHPGTLADGYSRQYPGAFRWLSPGEGGPKDIRVESVVVPQDAGRAQREHAPWIELKFDLVVPE